MRDLTDDSLAQLPVVPKRKPESHKGDYGRVLIVGGSLGMAGAPAMAGMAALHSGAGLVTVAVPGCVQPTVAGFCPAFMTVALEDDTCGVDVVAAERILQLAANVDVVAVGPGLGNSPAAAELVHQLYASLACPVVVDADGLNALAKRSELLRNPGGPRVLTPHPGEFARLTNQPAPSGDKLRIIAACEFAERDDTNHTVVVLKGHHTVIAQPDRFAINTGGNPGMATGGTGDVLTGVVAALLGQIDPPYDAARLAVSIHASAGDLACDAVGETSLMATDLLDFLPQAFQARLRAPESLG